MDKWKNRYINKKRNNLKGQYNAAFKLWDQTWNKDTVRQTLIKGKGKYVTTLN